MAKIIDGKQLAKELNAQTKKRVADMVANGVQPVIVTILVGDDPASVIYMRNKNRKAAQLGIKSILKKFPADVDQDTVLATIDKYNNDQDVDAILVQEPLPDHLDGLKITNAIRPDKDVDGLSPVNLGKLFANQPGSYPIACTPRGIMTLLDHYHVPLKGTNALVVGRSVLVGKPMLALLHNADATATLANRYTQDLSRYARQADLLIVATGHANLIKAEDIKPGATVIDVGITRLPSGKLTGDVDFDHAKDVAGLITPVPGGVGPMTIATLMQQTADMAEWKRNNG